MANVIEKYLNWKETGNFMQFFKKIIKLALSCLRRL